MGPFYLFFLALTTTLIDVVYECFSRKYDCRASMRFSCAVGVCPIGWIVQGIIIVRLLYLPGGPRDVSSIRDSSAVLTPKNPPPNNIDLAHWGMALLAPIELAP
jgi:hypothetical protein